MKITESYLKKVIGEELKKLNEGSSEQSRNIRDLCDQVLEDMKFVSEYEDKYRNESFLINIRELANQTRNMKILNLGRDLLVSLAVGDENNIHSLGGKLNSLVNKIKDSSHESMIKHQHRS